MTGAGRVMSLYLSTFDLGRGPTLAQAIEPCGPALKAIPSFHFICRARRTFTLHALVGVVTLQHQVKKALLVGLDSWLTQGCLGTRDGLARLTLQMNRICTRPTMHFRTGTGLVPLP